MSFKFPKLYNSTRTKEGKKDYWQGFVAGIVSASIVLGAHIYIPNLLKGINLKTWSAATCEILEDEPYGKLLGFTPEKCDDLNNASKKELNRLNQDLQQRDAGDY